MENFPLPMTLVNANDKIEMSRESKKIGNINSLSTVEYSTGDMQFVSGHQKGYHVDKIL